MRKIILGLKLLIVLLIAGVLYYVLPRHDIGRITDTEVIRIDFTPFNRLFYAQADSASREYATRDVRLIYAVKKRTYLFGFIRTDQDVVAVYRNEDTGWIWPPYFKFDSSDLQAEAASLISTEDNPKWVVITKYGWRNRFLTIYPNVVRIKQVSGPDVTIIPWFNIFFFAFLFIAWLFARAIWRQFRERTIDPMLEQAGDKWDQVDARASRTRGRLSRWLASWRRKP